MNIKRVLLAVIMAVILITPAFAEGEKMLGGHVKMTLFDYAYGINKTAAGQEYSTQSPGMGVAAVILFLNAKINDVVSVEVDPGLTAITGATPSLGSKLGDQMSTAGGISLKLNGVDWGKAVVKLTLPDDFEVSAGILKPKFTLEYGQEMFWEDEFSGGKFAINDTLGRMQSMGVEAVKNFSLGDLYLPVYIYAINGNTQFADNNRQPMGMIHAEPEIGIFKFTGSFAAGRYDDKEQLGMTRWSGGVAINLGDINIRSEYAGGKWERAIDGVRATTPYGWYAKIFYKVSDWMKLMYHFDYVYNNYSGFNSFSSGPGEKYITNTPGIIISLYDTLLQFRVDIGDWSRTNGDSLLFTRTVLGWRATF